MDAGSQFTKGVLVSRGSSQISTTGPTRNGSGTVSDFTNFSNQVSANSLDFRFRSLQGLHMQNVSKDSSQISTTGATKNGSGTVS